MTPRFTPGLNATAVFRALVDLFVVHEILPPQIGVYGRHRCFLSGDVGRRQQEANTNISSFLIISDKDKVMYCPMS